MSRRFTFTSLPTKPRDSNEANIFIHGYSAGHTIEDRTTLLARIPESIRHHTNIFAFWPSSHFSRLSRNSVSALSNSTRTHWALGVARLVGDRALHFLRIRSRAEAMGAVLLDQLNEHLRLHHFGVDTINLVGHSLGGRLVVSSLRKLSALQNHRLAINDVLLMAAAVTVAPDEAQHLRYLIKGRLINAYSKSDWTLLMNIGEANLGRNHVEHFENIRMDGFGHGDYWMRLTEVLTHTRFKFPIEEYSSKDIVLAETVNAHQPEQPVDEKPMKLELNSPSDVYKRINDELTRISTSLSTQSTDDALSRAQDEARALLKRHQAELQEQLAELEKNAEWNTFTIAFYGETGAGKSSIIETLRIMLQEPTKIASQQAFRELQSKCGLSEECLHQLHQAIEQADLRVSELTQLLSAAFQEHEQLRDDAMNSINRLQAAIAERKRTASLWEKLLNLFRKMPEESELMRTEQQLLGIIATRESITAPLLAKQAEAEHKKLGFERQLQESEIHLAELNALADGDIIGDGRADFTRQTQRYDFELDGQKFALLDVPGIEGKEELALTAVVQAVQSAHAVFYVTNQAAPPQTGDDQRQGTLEKIKAHLGAQTEVWTIFNKKITNVKHALTDRALISDDESDSLTVLDEKMRGQLGAHYRRVFPLTVLPAFLASTNHFAPNSQNAKRRSKFLADFSADELLEKSRLRSFVQLLNDRLLFGSKAKIPRANLHKANTALGQTIAVLEGVQGNFTELSKKLSLDGQSAQAQLSSSFSALKMRLETVGETLIGDFKRTVREKIYARIEGDIGNDYFEYALRDEIDSQQEQLSEKRKEAMTREVERFQKDAEYILKRFEEQTRELTDIYAKLNGAQINDKFHLKLDLDNGLRVGNLLAALAGGVLLWWNPAGWFILAMGLFSVALGAYKAVRGVFSTDYRMSQQRKATDDNLNDITKKLCDSLRKGLRSAVPEMQEKITLLEQALAAPAKQSTALVQLLRDSATQLKALSRQIENEGSL